MDAWEASRALTVEKSPCSLLLASIPRERAVVPQPSGSTKVPVFAMKKNVWRAMIEVGFIVFLFIPIF